MSRRTPGARGRRSVAALPALTAVTAFTAFTALRTFSVVSTLATLAIATLPVPARAAESLMLVVPARGAHHWVCDSAPATATATGPSWRLERVELELLEPGGRPLPRLGAGERWLLTDGTRVRGQLEPQSDVPRRDDLPWIELQAHGPRGRATRVAQVMRFDAGPGRPAGPACSAAALGTRALLPWSGEYYFFKPA